MSSNSRRVAVTGLGAICGVGHNVADIWAALMRGQSGISLIERINLSEFSTKIGGEIKNFTIAPHLLSPKDAPRYDHFLHFILHATDEAYKDAKLDSSPYSKTRMACIFGVGMGGFPMIEETHKTFMEKGPRRISPFFIPGVIPNMSSGLVSLQFGIKGVNYSISSACASSAHAISAAAQEIMLGRHDVVITGGGEGALSYLSYGGFCSMKALSRRNDEPTLASRPFDKDRDGFVMGEGAGVLILEDYDKAKARGAKIYALVVGHGASSDAYHITAPHPEGEGAITSMKQCLADAGVAGDVVDYVNAHGTSTPLGDIAETKSLKHVFADHAYKLNVSSTKSMTGHLLGGAGGLESLICVKAIERGEIPPTINLMNPDPECDLNYTANTGIKKSIRYALNNSFGFGGTNSTLLLKHPDA